MYMILNMKQRMVDVVSLKSALTLSSSYCCCLTCTLSLPQTGREIPPLRDSERVARVYTGDGVFKVRKNNEHRERERGKE